MLSTFQYVVAIFLGLDWLGLMMVEIAEGGKTQADNPK